MDEEFLSLSRLPYYEEWTWRILLRASNGAFAGTLECYTNESELTEFGRRLVEFPSGIRDEVSFQIGAPDGNWAHHLLLRTHVIDRSGHTVLEIRIENRDAWQLGGSAAFTVQCEPASLNQLGRMLVAWVEQSEEALVWRPCRS